MGMQFELETEKARRARRLHLQQKQTIIFGWLLAVMILIVLICLPFASGLLALPIGQEFSLSAKQMASYPPCAPTGEPVKLAGIKAEVLNGSSHVGMAKQTGELLTKLKVEVVNIGNNNDAFSGNVLIKTSKGKVKQAYSLARVFPGSIVRLGLEENEPIEVILGEQFEVPVISKEMAKAEIFIREEDLGAYPISPEECK